MEKDMIVVRINNEYELRIARFITGFKYATRQFPMYIVLNNNLKNDDITYAEAEIYKSTCKEKVIGIIELIHISESKGIKPSKFKSEFDKIQKEVHRTAIDKGWWNDNRSDAECIALMHSELSECLEALRRGDSIDEHCKGFMNSEVELADCIIRIMDFAEKKRYRLSDAIIEKMKANKRREKKHGKRF